MIQFLIADDHHIVQVGIKALLADRYPQRIVHTCGDGDSLMEMVKKSVYQLIILDIHMPRSGGLSLVRLLRTYAPDTKVLIYSASPVSVYAVPFIRAGASGYVSKEDSLDELAKAVGLILEGKRYINPELAEQVTSAYFNEEEENRFRVLTAREFEIAILMLKGHSATSICETLNLQKSTVSTFKLRIFEKLGISNLLELSELARLYSVNY